MCGSTHQLQFHHIVPFARGGAATVENTKLVCSAHNAHFAEQDFGTDHMRRMRDSSRVGDAKQLSLV